MKDFSTFDILGPIMIGPSSSHTAGAVKLGKIAMEISNGNFYKVEFYLHGSFAKTYKGHGTDKALVAGILGFEPSDDRIRNSLNIAKNKNIDIKFIEKDLGYQHPNTVKILFKYRDKKDFYVIGSSIGGGNIVITDINGDIVEFTGDLPTMILKYKDKKGIISKISSILSNNELNIATMKVTRDKDIATMICETDSKLSKNIIDEISNLSEITYSRFMNPIRR
ncbi:L-serine ammonia-lyase, iron-sulfur-dependent subunit beta [Paratissierella segnis]|jgi:L-serine dehydratase|uniref:L-serine deaminase n=1 Tax=Paratissierella segnis TaxID=2763679 RepID=A0A926IGB8_9FIRM|nr:L-serine ammonia-lyase, iron-sulfur-dependent subunit beta [Paratissierella segnis]MBC8589422.1 L-serine ammonia-lyase, iron-sulfur-dependent, subunit beta [Paratissierella segnis]